ncbi:MlaE family ABC transporter permease [Fimbriiglobus ruber]|uniref:ABC-type transport system, permease component n=1 Tax=Fimbriiglobus ruber TaxID=1908690 RepID=A0A225CZN5_9BACT|nr:ABC transporter permease [Fimbriiglobus ruber]OWK34801.1 ABC-type transport system, permease component [Fimbriiglobus ruber]
MRFVTALFDALARVGDWAYFFARATFASAAAVVHPTYWLRPLHGVLVGGLPLACVLGLALGVVMWAHTRGVLARTSPGAVDYLPTFLAAAVLLELSPIGAGLIVAARTGASLGAELAAMRVNEQVDALELLGVSPLRRLVGPRVLACIVATPLLHVLITILALGSGYVAEAIAGQTTWLKYQNALLQELRLDEVIPAGLKTVVFGALVGATGCFVGLRAEGGSEGVGKATTDSVVVCSLLVLAADVFLVGLIRFVFG